ncbi:MAG: YolD-like family protein [Bacilli bacterium]|nr:YolD-like family protein [Bacilli bacterium]
MNNEQTVKRGIAKWGAFNSVVDGTNLILELEQERKHFTPPEFDEEVIINNENKLKKALATKSVINITYYINNETHNIKGVITKLDSIKKEIVLTNHQTISFYQIIKIT